MTTVIEPEALDAFTWFDRVGRFRESLRQADPQPARHIRQAYHLHCLAPDALKRIMPAPLEELELDAMLASGHYEAAVSSLVGTVARATSPAPGADESALSSGAANAWVLAVLEAWAASFLRLRPLRH